MMVNGRASLLSDLSRSQNLTRILIICTCLATLLLHLCQACEPGVYQLAQLLASDIDIRDLPNPAALLPEVANNGTKLFYNASIITLADGNYSTVEAFVTSGDTISYTGSLNGARAQATSDTEEVDLQGQAVLPGFVEPHVHLILSALASNLLTSLSPINVTTLGQAVQTISDVISSGKLINGTWVAGYGYDPSRVANHPDLTVDVLDKISNSTPIFILNQSGHIAYANTAALTAANVTASSVANNSNFQQVDGKLTGLLFEQATSFVGKFVPQPTGSQLLRYCVQTLDTWMSKGCTTIFDAGIGSVGVTDVPVMAAIPAVPIRIHGAISGLLAPTLNSAVIKEPPFSLGQVNITSIKFWADGSTQGFTAAVNDPYTNPPTYASSHGLKNYANASTLRAAISPWLSRGFQIVVHSNGDAATDMVLDAYEGAFNTTPNRPTDIMHRIEHFTVTEPSQLIRAKALGLGISHTIGHVYYWGLTFINYVLGWPRAFRVDPLKSDTDAGLTWSLHSDSPITEVNPLLYLKIATSREMYPAGTGVLDIEDAEKVDLLTALKAITINPARQLGIDSVIGTLEVGKRADFVILDKDVRNVQTNMLDSVNVMQTWIGGSMVYRA